MYLRPAFAESDHARIVELIRGHHFGLLITAGAGGITASPIPFGLDETEDGFTLFGHLAAGNPQCADLDGGEALAVFSGPHAYVSPSWYRTQPAVPTWDYAAVHVGGRLALMTDPAEIAAGLDALASDDPAGFTLATLPGDFRARMVAGIRAFRLVPDRVETQWKMSQNRSPADREGVITALKAQGDATAAQVASLIAETLPKAAG